MPLLEREVAQRMPDGVMLAVYVQPKAARSECAGVHGHALKIRVAAPPVGGAANDELRRFLAECLDLPQRAVEVRSGSASRRKQVFIRGASLHAVKERLGL